MITGLSQLLQFTALIAKIECVYVDSDRIVKLSVLCLGHR